MTIRRTWPHLWVPPSSWAARQVSKAHSPTFLSLHLRHNSFSNPSVALSTPQLIIQPFRPTSQLILQPFRPTSQLILQPFRRFTYTTTHSPTLPLLHLCHSSFSNPYVTLPTPQLILQPFHCFTYITAHSSTLTSLYLCHNSFSNPSSASPKSRHFHLRHLASRPCRLQHRSM